VKSFLAWLKSNIAIVGCLLVIVVVLPTSYFVSRAWGESIRREHEEKVGRELSRVTGARVDYVLPSYDPAAPALTFKAEPNARLTEWFKRERERLDSAAKDLLRRAVDFNRGVGPEASAVYRSEHRPLVEGLFGDAGLARIAMDVRANDPARWEGMTPEERFRLVRDRRIELEQSSLLYEMEDRLLGKRGYPDPYRKILDSIRAGGRADPVRVLQVVREIETREVERVTPGRKRELTAKEKADLAKMLTERRLGEYQARAREISVYAGPEIFPRDNKEGVSIAYDPLDPRERNPAQMFLFQWDLWVLSDLLTSVRVANSTPDGRPTSVDQSPVKRIISVRLQPPEGLYESDDPYAQAPQEPTSSVPGMLPQDFSKSFTGRRSGPWNKIYDLRYAKITAIVASARLGDFLAAIERTNFMTVTGLSVKSIDPFGELKDGYFHGMDHLVEATIDVESAWLREWTVPHMPDEIKGLLGVAKAEGLPDWATARSSGTN
jgi:hypothetical protein